MARGRRAESAHAMFRNYDQHVSSSTQSAVQTRAARAEEKDPNCCCCKATAVIIACNSVTFFVAIAIMIVGFFINNEVSGWSLSMIDLLGSLCIATGAFLFVISILGVMAARTHHITFMFAYFILTLLLVSAICLAVVYAVVETDHISTYLEENWEDIEAIICAKDICDLTYDEANELIHRYFYVLVGVGITAISMQLVTLFSAMRMLGLRAIAISCLITIGFLGCAEIAIAILTHGEVNRPTTWLLVSCAIVQMVCSVCGICGFKSLNRECIKWAFLVLLISSGGLVFVVVSTYSSLKNEEREHPEHLLLLFGIALISAFFMFSALLFGAIFYCRRRSAFREADAACELHGQFSDCGAKRRPPRRGKAREYNARAAL